MCVFFIFFLLVCVFLIFIVSKVLSLMEFLVIGIDVDFLVVVVEGGIVIIRGVEFVVDEINVVGGILGC